MERLFKLAPVLLGAAIVGLVAFLGVNAVRGGGGPAIVVGGTPSGATARIRPHRPATKNKLAYLSRDDATVAKDKIGPRKWKIIDVHEHIKGEVEAQMLLKTMDMLGIQRTALMASTIYTLTLDPQYGFEGFKENNEALLAVEKKWPDRFVVFVTIDPAEEGNLALLKDYVARGADGIKLYLGHGEKTGKGPFHVMPLDDERMEPIWAWAEQIQLPIVCHVNLNKYWDELVRVLEKHPDLVLNIPHFGLHKNTGPRLQRLSFLLKRYPHVYTDVSFGYYTFQIEGFEALGKFRSRSKQWILEHKDKVLFASDMVLEPTKDQPYIDDTVRSYMQFLELDRWRFFLAPDYTMHGLGLDDDTLSWIYEKAPARFLRLDENGRPPDRERGVVPTFEKTVLPPFDPLQVPSLTAAAPRRDDGAASDDGDDGAGDHD